ncbi:MAG: L-histidine N(alpha)-methyltransferase [Acidobacteriia bacterium]|nr:L-histidine N(alpha)-methyltransferase [Terriglobia bacterium]
MLELDVFLTENQMAEEFRAALERRYLPEKFFYWFPLSVQAWLNLCQDSRPYKNYSRSYQLLSRYAREIARQVSAGILEVVSVGSGQGDKDMLLLVALAIEDIHVRYRPVDSSQALLETALACAGQAGFAARGIKADVENLGTFADFTRPEGGPRLYLILGNTLSVMDPREFLKILRGILRPDDRLLVDAEIYQPGATMAGYDNPVNRQFAFAPLASIGLEEGRDGELVFEERHEDAAGLHFVAKYFRAARPLRLLVAGEWIEIAAGEKLQMNASCKYSPDVFPKLLREVGGFDMQREYFSDDRQFLMALAAPGRK